MFSRSFVAQCVGMGFVAEGLQGIQSEIEDPRRLLLDGADVADGVLGQAGAGVEGMVDLVLEVALGLVDARHRVVFCGHSRLEFAGRFHFRRFGSVVGACLQAGVRSPASRLLQEDHWFFRRSRPLNSFFTQS